MMRLSMQLLLLLIWSALVSGTPMELIPAKRHGIEMRDFAFKPAVVNVAAGDTLVWMNRDVVPHTATAETEWNTGTISANASGSWIARGKGEVTYVCVFHRGMIGKIVVE